MNEPKYCANNSLKICLSKLSAGRLAAIATDQGFRIHRAEMTNPRRSLLTVSNKGKAKEKAKKDKRKTKKAIRKHFEIAETLAPVQ